MSIESPGSSRRSISSTSSSALGGAPVPSKRKARINATQVNSVDAMPEAPQAVARSVGRAASSLKKGVEVRGQAADRAGMPAKKPIYTQVNKPTLAVRSSLEGKPKIAPKPGLDKPIQFTRPAPPPPLLRNDIALSRPNSGTKSLRRPIAPPPKSPLEVGLMLTQAFKLKPYEKMKPESRIAVRNMGGAIQKLQQAWTAGEAWAADPKIISRELWSEGPSIKVSTMPHIKEDVQQLKQSIQTLKKLEGLSSAKTRELSKLCLALARPGVAAPDPQARSAVIADLDKQMKF